ncbi:corepressor interacting with RBPJ 1-like [Uloborus diversus]|uniref:corepressor interacting with RBPJ 1-like n=1 Tax=Uloborus diversus TaxID=327109 RepID=UPI00240A6163|nr:corepressor interacting with RBPJ 1-like [Uloborus diversus]
MGKGYNNYMCKKPFHPGSKANIKRAWMAEQKTENEKKKQEELKTQYEKEQDLYNNRALLSTESKDKLELNFMYEAPPGAKRERQKEDDEPEYKFEWQRKYNAPREDYAKGNADIKDQPFGIPVRNVRCIKCHKWGHINTDKECPLYSQASTSAMPTTSMDPMELMRQMREDGYGLKENVLGHHLNPKAANQQFLSSGEESDPEMEFLKSLTTAEKKKLLRKLKKLSKKKDKSTNCKKKKNRKSRKSKHSSDSEPGGKKKCKKSKKTANDSDSNSSSNENEPKSKRGRLHKKSSEERAKKLKKRSKSESSSSSGSESEEETHLEERKFSKKKHSEESESDRKDISGKSDKLSHAKSSIKNDQCEKSEKKLLKDSIKSHYDLSTKMERKYQDKEKAYRKDSEPSSREKYVKSSNHNKDNCTVKPKSCISSNAHQPDVDKHNDRNESGNQKQKSDRVSDSDQPNKRRKNVSESDPSVHEGKKNTKNEKYDHPDGFSHLNPQAVVKSNYVQAAKEYEGMFDDKFRSYYRDKRSPSVKQKYKK